MPDYSCNAPSTASPEAAWRAWSDIPAYENLDQVTSARLDGPFEVGSKLAIKVKGLPPSKNTITVVEPPRRWVEESSSLGTKVVFDHLIEPTANGCRLTETMTVSGPLGGIVNRFFGGRLRKLMVAAIRNVAERAPDYETAQPAESERASATSSLTP